MNFFTYKTSIIFFLVICLIFFQQTIRFGKLPIPTDTLIGLYYPWRDAVIAEYPRGMPFKNFLITDPIRQQIPWRKEAIERLKRGELPLLSMNSGIDVPVLGNIQSGALYPFNLLFFFLPFNYAWTLLIIFQMILSGLFFFLYSSHLKLHPIAACVGALAWSFCGFSVAWLTWGTIVHTSLWLPLLLFAIDRWREEKSIISLILFCLGLCCSFLAGHAQIFFYICLISMCYIFWRMIRPANETSEKVGVWYISGLFLSVVMFLFVTYIQWFPLYHALQQSTRISEEILQLKEGWFIPFKHLLQLFAPDFFGNPATLNYWGTWNYGEMVSYIGILPLLFIIPTLLFCFKKNAFWVLIIVITILFMTPTTIALLPYELKLPFLSTLQPTRITALFQFALIMLSVIGVDYIIINKLTIRRILITLFFSIIPLILLWGFYIGSKEQFFVFIPNEYLEVTKRNIILPTVLVIVFISLFIMARIKKILGLTMVILITIISFELLRFGWKFTSFTDQKYFFPETKTIQFLNSLDKNKRVMTIDSKVFPPNTNTYYNLPFVSLYDPLSSERYETFIAAMERGKPDITKPFGFNRIVAPQSLYSPLFSHLSVGYIVSLSEIPSLQLVHQEGETRVYKMKKTIPIIYLVSDAIAVKSLEESINVLYSPTFALGKQAVIEGEPIQLDRNSDGELHIIEYLPEKMIVNVTSGGKMLIVINRLFDPWWKVTINGHPGDIIKTNSIFMGVIVPSGTHTINFSYGIRL